MAGHLATVVKVFRNVQFCPVRDRNPRAIQPIACRQSLQVTSIAYTFRSSSSLVVCWEGCCKRMSAQECLESVRGVSPTDASAGMNAAPRPVAVDMVPPSPVQIVAAAKTGPRMDRRWVTAAVMLVMVLASMEQTVTSTAMPTIIGSLHGLEHYSWVASIYLLACTVSMPLYGRLADSLGRKRVILFAIALFAISSLLASTSRTMPELIAYRGFQGL